MINKDILTERFYRFDDYILDLNQTLLFHKDKMIPLGQKSFECLLLLVQNSERVVLKEEFFERIWENSFVEDGVLAVNISYLRKVFSKENQNHKFIETLPRRGYKFTAEVYLEKENPFVFEDPEKNQDFPHEISDHYKYSESSVKYEINDFEIDSEFKHDYQEAKYVPEIKRNQSASMFGYQLIKYSISLFLLVLVTFLIYKSYISTYYTTNVRKISILIFPFENIDGKNEIDYLSISLADSLNYSLTNLSNTTVVPTSNIKKFVKQSYNPVKEGKLLGVENIISGNFYTENDKISVVLNITNMSNEKPVMYQQTFESSVNNLTTLRTSILNFIISSLNISQSDYELLELQQQETKNPTAYESYLKGSDAFLNVDLDKAIMYFEKALESDPNFLLAMDRLAMSYYNKGTIGGCGKACYDKGISYYEKLLQIKPDFNFAKLRLSLVYVETNQIDKSIKLIKEVLENDKNNKYAYFCLSYVYRYAGLLNESIESVKRSQLIGNEDYSSVNIITTYIYLQEYDRFLKELHLPSNNPYGLFYKGLAQYYQNNFSEAQLTFDKSYQIGSDILIVKLGKVLSLHIAKEEKKALSLLNTIYDDTQKSQINDGEVIYKIAQAYSELNQSKRALELFNLSVDKGFFCYQYFKYDPLLNNIRKDPQFEKILKKAQERHEEFKMKHLVE